MNRTDAPKKQPVPFGTNGPRQDLLETTPAGSNRASYDAGYPQVTMLLKSAGGKPPEGEDMNQILFELSAIGRWQSAGALNSFDSSFSTAIGGYPKASVLVGSDGTTIYISTVDANTNDPNSSTTGWLNLSKITAIASLTAAADTLAYFTGVNSAAITALTSVGRDVIGQSTLASLVQYLGLQNVSRSRITSYTTAGTYSFTVPDAVYRIHCRVVGAGGGAGGSASAKSGGGGGGGGYAEGVITVTPGQVISITVGAQGNGGPVGDIGTSGGLSSIGSFMSASGGAYGGAGGGGTGSGGFGGTGSGGDINSVGSDGSDGTSSGAVGGGAGGGSLLGGSTRSGTTGRNSLSIGGGGAASYALTSQSGGNGKDGAVILEY